jgi:hypothetical protein
MVQSLGVELLLESLFRKRGDSNMSVRMQKQRTRVKVKANLETAEGLLDGLENLTGGLSATLGRHTVPVKCVIPYLNGIIVVQTAIVRE